MILDPLSSRKPELVGWGITNRCNLSCPHCYSSASKTAVDELTTPECLSILDSLGSLGAARIGWTGGEPLLRKDLETLVERATRLGIDSAITTNGTPLTRERARSLAQAGVRSIQVSLDGSNEKRNGMIRRATATDFQRTIRGILAARDAGMTVHMAMLIGAETLDDARDYICLAKKLDVASVRFCGYVPWGFGKRNDALVRLDLRGRLSELRFLVEELENEGTPQVLFDPGFGPLPPSFEYHECVAGISLLYIAPNGDVYPCTSLLDERFRIGNLRTRSLEAIWNDSGMSALARYPRENIHGPCRDCEAFDRCGGACRGITYAYTGDLNASFPLCMACAAVSA
jgi:radical SAM protein with 4Fe4S-binding SPASM domain